MGYAFFPEMLKKSSIFIFGSFLGFKSITCFFSRKAPLFYVRKSWNAPFFHLILKMGKNEAFQDFWTWKVGNFKNNARYRFETEKRIENEYVRFWGIFKTNKNAITCKIYNKNTFCSISINSPLLRNWVLILGSYLTGLCL